MGGAEEEEEEKGHHCRRQSSSLQPPPPPPPPPFPPTSSSSVGRWHSSSILSTLVIDTSHSAVCRTAHCRDPEREMAWTRARPARRGETREAGSATTRAVSATSMAEEAPSMRKPTQRAQLRLFACAFVCFFSREKERKREQKKKFVKMLAFFFSIRFVSFSFPSLKTSKKKFDAPNKGPPPRHVPPGRLVERRLQPLPRPSIRPDRRQAPGSLGEHREDGRPRRTVQALDVSRGREVARPHEREEEAEGHEDGGDEGHGDDEEGQGA